jgi:fructose-bisphosphate aldolase class I
LADESLRETARTLVVGHKGILAADEGDASIEKRLESIGIESTEANRRAYRDMLFTTPGAEKFISGVILFDETIRQRAVDGTPFPELLRARGLIVGIKADIGAFPLPFAAGETVTEGLDGLRPRLEEYRDLGARFAKWRAPLTVGDGLPSDYAVHANTHALARYAAVCQEAGLVPIVEPDLLMDGAHSLAETAAALSRVLQSLYEELHGQRVDLPGTLLKPNMVLSGYRATDRAGVEDVAEATLECFYECVPAAVPGIVFLSGGQSSEDATAHLDAMNRRGPHPWTLSFSFSRALQNEALVAWGGSNIEAGQREYYKRAKLNAAACAGAYAAGLEAPDQSGMP